MSTSSVLVKVLGIRSPNLILLWDAADSRAYQILL